MMFKELFETLKEQSLVESLNITIKKTGEELTVLVTPVIGGKSSVMPVSMKGTPEEFDSQFAAELVDCVRKNSGVISSISSLGKSLEEEEERLKKKKDDAASKGNSSSSSSSSSSGGKGNKKGKVSEEELEKRKKALAEMDTITNTPPPEVEGSDKSVVDTGSLFGTNIEGRE